MRVHMSMSRDMRVLQERGALSERVMNEMRRLEEIRDQCCRLRESAAADVAAERKVQCRARSVHFMSHANNCRRCVKIEQCCCVSSRKLHSRSLLVCAVSLSGRRA